MAKFVHCREVQKVMRICGTFFLILTVVGNLSAQTFTTLHSFTARVPPSNGVNYDGSGPYGSLVLSGGLLYGTAIAGGNFGNGLVFSLSTNGLYFVPLYYFSTTGAEGAHPHDGLIVSSNTIYGTALLGGSGNYGTIFRINTDGSSFTNLHSFIYSDGDGPNSPLVLSGDVLFGTTEAGSSMRGTVFRINTDGSGFTNLHNFSPVSGPNSTNSDGDGPQAGLILDGNTLYGTAYEGGSSGNGTVFRVNVDGSGFTNLHNFSAKTLNGSAYYTNSDGINPESGLVLSGSSLYGVAVLGGTNASGTVFKVNTDGTGFRNLHSFGGLDGANPYGVLFLSGSTLYGTANSGGTSGSGTIFALNVDGTGFTNLYNFTKYSGPNATNRDGFYPFAGLVLSGRTFFGTAFQGGNYGNGTVFSFMLPVPSLGIGLTGSQVVISWPTLSPNYVLQTTTNLVSGSWSNITGGMFTSGYDYLFTNAVNGRDAFFRLAQ